MTTIAFIGFGEAGSLLAEGLIRSGASVPIAYDILIDDPVGAPALIRKAKLIGTAISSNVRDAVADSELIFAAVTCSDSSIAAASVASCIKTGQTYIDINSTSPMVKKANATLIEAAGGAYIDVAVMDLVPPHGHKVPMLLSGKTAAAVAPILKRFGMTAEAIDEEVGTASTIKMVRSVFLKGFSAILIESLVAASKVHAHERVLDSLQITFPQINWRDMADYYATRLMKHAKRQAAEMTEVAETLEFLGLEPLTATATGKRLEWFANLKFDEALPLPTDCASFLRALGGDCERSK
jgi:3-hydroxyisobutyrate dehydrogenase-like beta-hydroxyacid dehydrogenase